MEVGGGENPGDRRETRDEKEIMEGDEGGLGKWRGNKRQGSKYGRREERSRRMEGKRDKKGKYEGRGGISANGEEIRDETENVEGGGGNSVVVVVLWDVKKEEGRCLKRGKTPFIRFFPHNKFSRHKDLCVFTTQRCKLQAQ